MWPSTRLSEMVIERLKAHNHPSPYGHLRYEGAEHMITLLKSEPENTWSKRYEVGESREANEFVNTDLSAKVLGFLEHDLKHKAS